MSNPNQPQFPQGQPPYNNQQGQPQGYQQGPQQRYDGPPQGYPQQGYQQPPMAPQTPPKKKRRGLLIAGIVIAVLLFGCIGAAIAASSHTGTAPATTAGTTTTTNTQATSAPTKAPVQQKWTTTHTFTGNGSKKFATFAVPGDWKLLWTCDPASFTGGQYNVIITPTGTDNTPVDAGINTICKAGNTSGDTEIRTSGNVFLDVTSEASYTIKIQELK